MVATALAMNGILAIVVAAVLSRMEGQFRLFGLSGTLRAGDAAPTDNPPVISKDHLENYDEQEM